MSRLTNAQKENTMDSYERQVRLYTEDEERDEVLKTIAKLNMIMADIDFENLVKKRKNLKSNIKRDLGRFRSRKWINIMDVPDMVAISIMRNLDKHETLMFTVGTSVTEGLMTSLRHIGDDMGIKPLVSYKLYELSGRNVRMLTTEEENTREFRAPRAILQPGSAHKRC